MLNSTQYPNTMQVAGRDGIPTGQCQATEVTGRVLAVRGDTLVVGGDPIIRPAPDTACYTGATAAFVPPPNAHNIHLRRPTRRRRSGLGIGGFVVYAIDEIIHDGYPRKTRLSCARAAIIAFIPRLADAVPRRVS